MIRIALAQIKTESDLSRLYLKLKEAFRLAEHADLIVFPEFFNTVFELESIRKSADQSPLILEEIRRLCRAYGLYCVAGSLAVYENGKYYNRSYVIDPDGRISGSYDKIHPLEVHARKSFREADLIHPGDHLFTFRIRDFVFGLVLCYDVRFFELCGLYGSKVDALIVPAAFNEAVGKKHWKVLLQARAIENQVYVVGINPAFKDYGSYRSYGHSLVVDPDGKIVLELGAAEDEGIVELDKAYLEKIRERQPYNKLKRKGLYKDLEENHEF